MRTDEKVRLLMQLVDIHKYDAESWFPFVGESVSDTTNPIRKKIIQAVMDIEAGIVSTPLWQALQ